MFFLYFDSCTFTVCAFKILLVFALYSHWSHWTWIFQEPPWTLSLWFCRLDLDRTLTGQRSHRNLNPPWTVLQCLLIPAADRDVQSHWVHMIRTGRAVQRIRSMLTQCSAKRHILMLNDLDWFDWILRKLEWPQTDSFRLIPAHLIRQNFGENRYRSLGANLSHS